MNKPANKVSTQRAKKIADKVLREETGRTLDEHIALANEADTIDILNEYRSALSLWAEHTDDTKQKVIITLDGRDTAGKGSNIKRVTEYFNGKRHKTNAYGIPEIEERIDFNWFRRYIEDFPRKGQVAFFDRSWYNRAGVEAAMGFCTQEELARMKKIGDFKTMKDSFHFRVPTDEEVEYVENFRKNNIFVQTTYSYTQVK